MQKLVRFLVGLDMISFSKFYQNKVKVLLKFQNWSRWPGDVVITANPLPPTRSSHPHANENVSAFFPNLR